MRLKPNVIHKVKIEASEFCLPCWFFLKIMKKERYIQLVVWRSGLIVSSRVTPSPSSQRPTVTLLWLLTLPPQPLPGFPSISINVSQSDLPKTSHPLTLAQQWGAPLRHSVYSGLWGLMSVPVESWDVWTWRWLEGSLRVKTCRFRCPCLDFKFTVGLAAWEKRGSL